MCANSMVLFILILHVGLLAVVMGYFQICLPSLVHMSCIVCRNEPRKKGAMSKTKKERERKKVTCMKSRTLNEYINTHPYVRTHVRTDTRTHTCTCTFALAHLT